VLSQQTNGETQQERVAVVGLGYVGLPLAVALADHLTVLGFDIDARRIAELTSGHDRTGEITADRLTASSLTYSTDPKSLSDSTFIVVTVPTPVDQHRSPDFGPLRSASKLIGSALSPGAVVVYESTVYPGATEEICIPILERESGLKAGSDFFVGYSPERINPGDLVHTIDKVVKIISAQDPVTLARLRAVYGSICTGGLHEASSIQVAEAAKVIENTQRDLNIALMNELALIFDRLGISTREVLNAAGTKWNFLPFVPGLVGGHCIGVDPYYLTHKAESVGYHPDVILAGRRVNDGMGQFIAAKTTKLLASTGVAISAARVLVLGLTFKEDVPDLRNSRVPDIINELREFGARPEVVDPYGDPAEALHEYGIELASTPSSDGYDAVILAVAHKSILEDTAMLATLVRPGGFLIDVKSVVKPSDVAHATVWTL
jgi:UDP-N-acetyl-D-glucosamine/UDP-N-acetyl-D-galactosamine dehydrogenase